jgi:uncharacterized protein
MNAVNWFEIPVANLDRAMAFYAAMTGKALKRETYGAPGEEMASFQTGSAEAVSGALVQSPHAKPAADGTTVYLNAEPSVDAWLARVEKAGGQIVVPKTEIPGGGMGYFAHIIDSEGNRVGLHAMA